MENRFRAIAGSTRGAEPRRNQLADDARLARAAAADVFFRGMPRVNVMLVGQDEVVQLVLQTLLGHVREPISSWSPGEQFALPPIGRAGTLVLHEVGALGLREQIQLLEWSERAMRNTQVISTTSAPLFPRVCAGTFVDTLYYRLNIVYMDVTALDEAA
jgi:sigma54-dependent transcription regulator